MGISRSDRTEAVVKDAAAPRSAWSARLVRLLGMALWAGLPLGCSNPEDGSFGSGGEEREDEQREDDELLLEELEEKTREGCERDVRLEVVSVQAPEPFDVVIVADHSESLSWSRQDLASGLRDFLSQVRGHEVRFYVLSPTQYGASSATSVSAYNGYERVEWKNPGTGEPYQPAMTHYSQVCQTPAGEVIECPTTYAEVVQDYTLTGEWAFEMPAPVAAITSQMDATALSVQSQAISDAILGLGLSGSSDEQPVCTLHRYLDQEPSLLPENVVFLILTDEDDVSDPARCLAGQTVDMTQKSQRDVYQMSGSGMRAQRRFNCNPVDDQGQIVGDPVAKRWNLGACTAPRSCTAKEEQDSRDECPNNHVMSDCQVSCESSTFLSCRVDQDAVAGDPCSGSFTYSGETYESLLAYCAARHTDVESWGSCSTTTIDVAGTETVTLHPLVDVRTISEMIDSFGDKAQRIFGSEAYAVELIGFEPSFSCQPQAGQSYMTQLSSLADSPAHLFPICGDYAGALNQVRSFAGTLIQNDFALGLSQDEELQGVSVVSADGTLRPLSPAEFSFDQISGRLLLSSTALLPNDRGLDVDVLSACVIR